MTPYILIVIQCLGNSCFSLPSIPLSSFAICENVAKAYYNDRRTSDTTCIHTESGTIFKILR